MWLGVCIFLAGGLGALCRATLDAYVTARWRRRVSGPFRAFPAGTCLINVSGAFVLGVVTGFAAANTSGSARDFATVLGVGFLGAYTTFSTEEWHTLGLLRGKAAVEAWNVLGSLVASLLLAGLGLWLGSRF
ncbi:putative fluoride ion transporter CrcB [Catellatospora methionotrophica]|uniref:Fluoride-specific ion channel FluC n=1 Tax=Catellatospora methionotrophica TaxID=121620 RepID=A0A8J3LQ28_9ACTN|nr:CrcB family protein [Catellatospora methionotrophica]GIG16800.1 putative fluoride ion transporter CrcB [Catellatospora methionotrophica]